MDGGKAARAQKRVVVVDGDCAYLELVDMLFREEHFEVTTTDHAPRAVELISTIRPDVLIMDLTFRDTTTWDLLADLHREAIARALPVILTSTDPALLQRAKEEAGIYGTHLSLVKPLGVEDLLHGVYALIGDDQDLQ
jgi:CheY-like chemotaxis protein